MKSEYKNGLVAIVFLVSFFAIFIGNRLFSPNSGEENYTDGELRYSLVDRNILSSEELAPFLTDKSARFSPYKHKKLKTLTYLPENGKLNVRVDLIFNPKNPKEEVDESEVYLIPAFNCTQCRNDFTSRYNYSGETSGHHGYWSIPFAKRNAEWLEDSGSADMPINYTYSHFLHYFSPQQLEVELSGNITKVGLEKYTVLLTTYYERSRFGGRAPRYWFSYRDIKVFQVIICSLVALSLILQYWQQGGFKERRNPRIGMLLLIFSLLHLTAGDVHYMTIGMGIIAISATFLIFSHVFSKAIYFLGIVFITDVSHLQYGNSNEFFANVTMLWIIGALLFFFVHTDEQSVVDGF